MIRKILELIFLTILAGLSYIIPKKKGLYIFGGHGGKSFSGNSKAFYLYLKEKGFNSIYYYLTDKKSKSFLEKILKDKVNFRLANNFLSIRMFLRAEYIFLDASPQNILPLKQLYIFFGNFKTILLWHGDGFKKLESFKIYTLQDKISFFLYTLYCKTILFGITGNDFNKKTLSEAFLGINFKKIGLPRYDAFANKKLQIFIPDIRKELKLDNYSKLILYAPTWRDRNKFGEDQLISYKGLNKINQICKETNNLFIVKPHPNQKINIPKNFETIKILKEFSYDIEELLLLTDILITDYSSIFVDFLIKKQPILFYMPDLQKYLRISKGNYLKKSLKELYPKTYITQKEDKFINQLKDTIYGKYDLNKLNKIRRFILQEYTNCCNKLYTNII